MTDINFRDHTTVDLVQMCASDDMVAKAARVSTLASNDSKATQGFIDFLVREGHHSPLEHNLFTFLVEAPIFVTREMLRHRIGVGINEESGRYKVLDGTFYLPPIDRKLVQVGKTGDYKFEDGGPVHRAVVDTEYDMACTQAWRSYQEMLNEGVAKEVASRVLPLTTFSSMYMTFNARSLLHFLGLRTASNAQYEIREVALKMEWYLRSSMPMVWEAWTKTRP